MDTHRRLLVFTGIGMFVLASVMTGVSSSLVDMAKTLGVETTSAGIFYTFHFAGFLGLILLTLPARGVRSRLVMTLIAAGLYGIGLALVGLVELLPVVAVALFFCGGSGGVLESHTSSMLVATAKDDATAGSHVSLVQVFFALGALAAPAFLSVVQGTEGWQLMFLILAGFAVVGTVVGLSIPRSRLESAEASSDPIHWKSLWRACIAIALYVGAEVTIFGWIPTVMELHLGIPAGRARLSPALFWMGMLGGRLLIARLTKPVGPRRLLQISSGVGALAALLLGLVTAEIAVWLFLALAALGCAGIWPLIVATAGSTGRGVSTTIVVASGGIGAALFPYIAGRLAEVLPGHLIPAAAAPLLLVVLYLSGLRPGRAQEAAAAG